MLFYCFASKNFTFSQIKWKTCFLIYIVHWWYSTILAEIYSFILTIIQNNGNKKSCNKTLFLHISVNPSWFLNPWRFFNIYEEQNNQVGKAKPENGLVIQELIAYLCMVRRDLQTWKISLISHLDNQGKTAAARSGWDIRHFYLNYPCEGFEKKKKQKLFHHLLHSSNTSIICYFPECMHRSHSILNIKSSIKSHAPLAMRVLF